MVEDLKGATTATKNVSGIVVQHLCTPAMNCDANCVPERTKKGKKISESQQKNEKKEV
jgi:hypothetical protein